MNLELYHPVFFRNIMLVPEFLELIRTNKHRIDGILDIFTSGPDSKNHTYVVLMAPPNLPIDPPTAGFHVAYILPSMGVTSIDPTYKGMGLKINQSIASALNLFSLELKTVETTIAPHKPLKNEEDYLEWWKEVIEDIRRKLD